MGQSLKGRGVARPGLHKSVYEASKECVKSLRFSGQAVAPCDLPGDDAMGRIESAAGHGRHRPGLPVAEFPAVVQPGERIVGVWGKAVRQVVGWSEAGGPGALRRPR